MLRIKPKTLYITLSMLMVGLVVLVYGALQLYESSRSHALMLQQAGAAARRIGREAAATVEAELRPARISVALLASGALGSAHTQAERLAALPQLMTALRGNAAVSAVYVGTTGGSFLLLRRLQDAGTRQRMDAPREAAFALQSVDRDRGTAQGSYRFYDAGWQELQRRDRADYDFDPRTRPWYQLAARKGDGVAVQSAPYVFFTTGEPGVTLAQAQGEAVVGADVSLHALGELLSRVQISRSAELLIATADGDLLAQGRHDTPAATKQTTGDAPKEARLQRVQEAASPLMRALWAARTPQGELKPIQVVDDREWVANALALPGSAEASTPLTLLMASPREELQAFQIESRRHGFYISLGLVLLLLPLVHWMADRVSRPLRLLARQAEAIRHFEFRRPGPWAQPDPRGGPARAGDDCDEALAASLPGHQRRIECRARLRHAAGPHPARDHRGHRRQWRCSALGVGQG